MFRGALACFALLPLVACAPDSGPEAPAPSATPTAVAQIAPARVPAEGFLAYDPVEIERGRLDPAWRTAAARDLELRRQQAAAGPRAGTLTQSRDGSLPAQDGPPVDRARSAPAAPAPTPSAPAAAVAGPTETFETIAPEAFAASPALPVGGGEAAGPTVLRVQRLLDRARFSPGTLDGHWGKNTEKAVFWLQAELGLESTGIVDGALYQRLVAAAGDDQTVRAHTLTAEDLAGPFVAVPEEPAEQAELDCLCHASPAERLAERFHTTREVLAQLNPETDFERLAAGTELTVPNVEVIEKAPLPLDRIARLVISKAGWYLHAEDAQGSVLFHFPITIGSAYDPSPEGQLRVTGIAYDPDFHYQPKLFADVPDEEPEHLLPAGPNSPVGLVWMALSEENFGIHGTAEPATIGYTSSHGCIRMTNWDAVFLANHIEAGVPVQFVG
jgi:lipoprotein-anchoring transpeptidase ErfK/SrfK